MYTTDWNDSFVLPESKISIALGSFFHSDKQIAKALGGNKNAAISNSLTKN
jgi:hypothetical protein